jgi:hypothetical protein
MATCLVQGLIIVGNRHTLGNARRNTNISTGNSGAEYWRNLIRDLDAADAIVDVTRDGNEGIEIYQLNEELGELDDFASWTSALADSPPPAMEELVWPDVSPQEARASLHG